jgi:hypothetical protein
MRRRVADPKPQITTISTVITGACHGTSADIAKQILATGMQASDTGFLGPGAYFFEGTGAVGKARWWADKRAAEGKINRPLAVILASVELGRCLDFRNEGHADLVEKIAESLRKKGKHGFSDADVVALIAKTSPLDTIRATRTKPAFYGSHFHVTDANYLCVVNLTKIQNLKISFTWN